MAIIAWLVMTGSVTAQSAAAGPAVVGRRLGTAVAILTNPAIAEAAVADPIARCSLLLSPSRTDPAAQCSLIRLPSVH